MAAAGTDGAVDKVAVVVPAYNAERTIERAIRSVSDQAASVLVIEDGSNDGTWEVLEGLLNDIANLQVIRNKRNMGKSLSLNRAVDAVRQPWLAILDADDAMAPGRLERLLQVAEKEGLDAISDLPVECDPATGEPASKQRQASGALDRVSLIDLLRNDPETGLDLGMMKMLFRTELRDRGLLVHPDLRHGEDWALCVSLLRAGVRIGLLREAHYLFTTRIGADSGQISPFSVTRVNYRSIAEGTRAFLKDMEGDPALTEEVRNLSEKRIRDALKQNRVWGWTMLRKGERRRFLEWLASDIRNVGTVLRIMGRKLFGHRGLPNWD